MKNMSIESIQDKLMDGLLNQYQNKINNLFKEGLKIKGFEFENESDYLSFISINCRGFSKGNETTYYVNNIPFFFYVTPVFDYNFDISNPSLDFGKYSFL
ncbi:hypothetical protein UFOVP514_36 [uncultured Caudovirales phage]|jgi:hypothetical protein|uniref:Uncharacterized protein n=1 Tax=uncultured Caudovirales phage TaxID=2100421 RepID=A0A6J5MLT0_9CAUD|nr:hypothetical protein UFOVP514_36 [uncultured Caudovirales phage]